MTEWRFVWSHGDDHETGHALSREMLALYRDKTPKNGTSRPVPGQFLSEITVSQW